MARKKYPVVGGPLDGEAISSDEFEQPRPAMSFGSGHAIPAKCGGKHAQFQKDYIRYNRATGYAHAPTMIWLHANMV